MLINKKYRDEMYRIYLEIDGWTKAILVEDDIYNSGVVNVAFPSGSPFLWETDRSVKDMTMQTRHFMRTDKKKNGIYVFEAKQ